MHILILNWKDVRNPDVGGAEVILYELAKRMIASGNRVTWFCRAFPGGSGEQTIDGIHIIRRGNRYTAYWQAYLYYRSLSVKPDRVLDCINTICWQTPLYVPKNKRIAYVNQLAKEVFFYELPPVLSHLAYWLEPLEYVTYRDTKFICYSKSVRTDITTFGIPATNITVFPIGIDHHRYKPGIKSKDPLFLFVARLARMKRPDLTIEAMRIVIRKYHKAKLALVGYGPMQKQLERMIVRYRLQSNVFLVNKDAFFLDATPKDQKVKLMQEAWALLLPSVKEGWGMVVTEAGACETPSIVTRVTGLVDSVPNHTTGIILPAKLKAEDVADALVSIIADSKKRTTMSANASEFAKQFTWDNAYQKFLSFIL